MPDPDIRDDADGKRYVLDVDGVEAVVTYNLNGENLMITETLVPQALEGRGLAKRLAVHVLDDARARDLKVLPVCPFFAGYLQKHPDYADVVHPTYRGILGL
ncbi:GNAT family N-acetyltransferase [Brevundimonas lutea]|uniref:GNAT family N-acetyltransferase n=1 Tax=Brevundimonas lutea TaxID=2293980 RepID=UPI000F02D48F|nr:GNAT family N-acetyltransferase [Brevundimonas lutea]